jgi:uncharacterized protein
MQHDRRIRRRRTNGSRWTDVNPSLPEIYLSDTSTVEWQIDSDPPGEVHLLCDADGIQAGLWRPKAGVTPSPVSWVLPAREVVLVLQGEGRVELDGQSIELAPGKMVSLPQGSRTTWHITPDFKEFWILGL